IPADHQVVERLLDLGQIALQSGMLGRVDLPPVKGGDQVAHQVVVFGDRGHRRASRPAASAEVTGTALGARAAQVSRTILRMLREAVRIAASASEVPMRRRAWAACVRIMSPFEKGSQRPWFRMRLSTGTDSMASISPSTAIASRTGPSSMRTIP